VVRRRAGERAAALAAAVDRDHPEALDERRHLVTEVIGVAHAAVH
jgi:hypothetical protein